MADNLPTSSTSMPGLVAGMLELLALRPGMRVLEIGLGTGYNAALMAELVGDQTLVVSLNIQEDVVSQTRRLMARAGYGNVKLLARDGVEGVPEDRPFDRIVATVGCPDISPHWAEQLKPSGFMLGPLVHGGWCPLTRVWHENGVLKGRVVGMSGFMRIRGGLAMEEQWPGVAYSAEGAQELGLSEGLEGEEEQLCEQDSSGVASFL